MNTIFHNSQVVMLSFLSICLSVHMYIRSQQLHFIHTSLNYSTGLSRTSPAQGTKPVQLFNTQCINFLKHAFKMIGAQSQQVCGGEAHVLFPSHFGEDSVRGTRHTEHRTLSLQNGEQAKSLLCKAHGALRGNCIVLKLPKHYNMLPQHVVANEAIRLRPLK